MTDKYKAQEDGMALKIGIVGMRGIGNKHADCHMENELAELVAVVM